MNLLPRGKALPRYGPVLGLILLCCNLAIALPSRLDPLHFQLTPMLKKYVINTTPQEEYSRTRVNYRAWKDDPAWAQYLKVLRKADIPVVRSAPAGDQKAFWINTYNALVVDTIMTNYPIRFSSDGIHPQNSIHSIPEVWRLPHGVARRRFSLEQVEEELRRLEDVRVYFALCRSGVGSPPLIRTIYQGSTIEEQLDEATAHFIADPDNCYIDHARNELHVSALFEERANDLVFQVAQVPQQLVRYAATQRYVVSFIVARMSAPDRQYVYRNAPTLRYIPIDWTLNEYHK